MTQEHHRMDKHIDIVPSKVTLYIGEKLMEEVNEIWNDPEYVSLYYDPLDQILSFEFTNDESFGSYRLLNHVDHLNASRRICAKKYLKKNEIKSGDYGAEIDEEKGLVQVEVEGAFIRDIN